jgi:hypothetical protein
MNYRQKITSLCVPSPLNRKRTDKNRKDEKRFYLLQVLKGQEVDVCVCGVIIIVFFNSSREENLTSAFCGARKRETALYLSRTPFNKEQR